MSESLTKPITRQELNNYISNRKNQMLVTVNEFSKTDCADLFISTVNETILKFPDAKGWVVEEPSCVRGIIKTHPTHVKNVLELFLNQKFTDFKFSANPGCINTHYFNVNEK